jgi:hypothetical protein
LSAFAVGAESEPARLEGVLRLCERFNATEWSSAPVFYPAAWPPPVVRGTRSRILQCRRAHGASGRRGGWGADGRRLNWAARHRGRLHLTSDRPVRNIRTKSPGKLASGPPVRIAVWDGVSAVVGSSTWGSGSNGAKRPPSVGAAPLRRAEVRPATAAVAPIVPGAGLSGGPDRQSDTSAVVREVPNGERRERWR